MAGTSKFNPGKYFGEADTAAKRRFWHFSERAGASTLETGYEEREKLTISPEKLRVGRDRGISSSAIAPVPKPGR